MPNHIVMTAIRAAIRAGQTVTSDRMHNTIAASIVGMSVLAPLACAAESEPTQEVVVTGIQFKSNEAVSALKLPLELKDTPQTVMAVTADVIDFASIDTFEDVYKVDASGGSSHALDSFPRNYYRGFRQQGTNAIRLDGFRLSADLQLDLEPFESIEIVKGATSTLYGQNALGGTLNAISKSPRDVFGGRVSAEGGSYDHRRATADFYGPITSDGGLQYRVVGAWADDDSFLDLAGHKVKVIAPTIQYRLGEKTTLTARVNYQDHEFRYHFGTGIQCLCDNLADAQPGDFVIPDVARSTFFGQSWNTAHKEATFIQAALEHSFGDSWHLRVNAQRNHINEFSANDEEVAPDRNGRTIYGAMYANEKEDNLYAGELQVYGDVQAFGMRNTVFVGMDYQHVKRSRLHGEQVVDSGFNVYEPEYDILDPQLRMSDYPAFFDSIDNVEEAGLTAQVFLRPLEKWTLQIGGRYDDVKLKSDRRSGALASAGGTLGSLEDLLATPYTRFQHTTTRKTAQLGAVYAVTPNVNLYASYGQTFVPSVGVFIFNPANPNGDPAPPEVGRASEIGAKGEFLDRRIAVSLAAFDMVRSNLTQPRPLTQFVDVLGTQKSRGVELELQGAITPAFNLFTSIAFTDPQYDGGQFDGFQPTNSNRFGISAFGTYEIRHGAWQGFGFGGGVVHKQGRDYFGSDRQYANGEFVEIDFGSITEVDARVFYNADKWRVQLGGTNLTNTKYYSPYREVIGFGVNVNPPRLFSLRVTALLGEGLR